MRGLYFEKKIIESTKLLINFILYFLNISIVEHRYIKYKKT